MNNTKYVSARLNATDAGHSFHVAYWAESAGLEAFHTNKGLAKLCAAADALGYDLVKRADGETAAMGQNGEPK